MKKNSLAEAFEIKKEQIRIESISDYEIFPDKMLLETLRSKIIQNLIDKNIIIGEFDNDFINAEVNLAIEGYDLSNLERSHIFNLISDEISGYGPLTELLNDEQISEIMVNSPQEIYIEVNGQLSVDNSVSFINNEHIVRTINRLIGPLGRTIDISNPLVDCRLPNGARINAVIPPLSTKGPVMTIRKFKKNMTTVDDLIRIGALTPYMARFLSAAVMGKMNIIICGGAGSGKTTLLNILSSFIQNNERIITIEDAAELRLEQDNVVSLETKQENYEDSGAINIRDLVINALRMRPDRIIVGEVRGREAFDMLQAMNTGHEGSLTTIHANTAIDALNRLETLVLMNNMELNVKAVREYINNAIDLVINIDRMSDGKRKITSICEVNGLNENYILNEIFAFRQSGLTKNGEVNGEFILYNKSSSVYKRLKNLGINCIDDIFNDLPKKKNKRKE